MGNGSESGREGGDRGWERECECEERGRRHRQVCIAEWEERKGGGGKRGLGGIEGEYEGQRCESAEV